MSAPDNTGAFFAFMRERELIRIRKITKKGPPWTDDPILREYKFTNVRRFHDRTTTELRENFYSKNRSDDRKSILMNCALFRYFGTSEFAEAVGWQEYNFFKFEEIIRIASKRLDRGQRVFTGAYVITNQGLRAPKPKVVVDYFMRDLHEKVPEILEIVQMTRSWRKVAEFMSKIKGFGGTGFMSKEILLDTMMTDFWYNEAEQDGYKLTLPDDYDSWTPVGPGGLRGATRVQRGKPLDVILQLVEKQKEHWPKEYGHLHPADIQFQLCEFDKYQRVKLGQGRPRSKYKPR